MEELWLKYVDQTGFTNYTPWHSSYINHANDLVEPCTELWRRMFVWWDGKVNPCDVDYKSNLSVGTFPERKLSELWESEEYLKLRQAHIKNQRSQLTPCRSCTVI